ncbi:MAG: B12-binding domain-containing radical SAM protein [Candidatus Omnitrophica bacterium]|nr:B12-binding domain-containing radical SAM protein [Candidatus Omnitrophota bacterium]
MKLAFTSIDGGIITVGFRKMASFIKSIHADTEISYVVPTNHMSVASFLLGRCTSALAEADLKTIARHLAAFDIVAFSSMTPYADLTKDLLARIKILNPNTYLIWGGIHPIVEPEDAIQHADAVCVGEGEFAFEEFLAAYKGGPDFTQTKNFWFNAKGRIIKNGFLPLQTQEDLNKFPLPLYADDELIFQSGAGFIPMDARQYRKLNGIAYHTVWSIGCPYKCSYCSNSKFIDNDPQYRRVRFSSVDRIIQEVKEVRRKHPYIASVTFHDDSFIGLPLIVLEIFAEKWRKEINISFSVVGALPTLIRREKLAVLVKAGMYRIKMGIQSGSDCILNFYKRPATAGVTFRAVSIIAEFTDYMIPPTYDIILDNPIETRQDVIDTLKFIYTMPRPFSLNIFSLRVMPNTELENQLKDINVSHPSITEKNYTLVKPTFANILIFLIDIVKPPQKMFDFFLKFAKPYGEEQREFPIILFLVRALYMVKRGMYHLRYLEFSYFPGRIGQVGYFLQKKGLIQRWHQKVLKKSNSHIQ